MTRGRTYPGSTVVHGCACACPLCDPQDAKLKAKRAAFLAEKKAAAAAPPPPPAAGFPVKTGVRAGARPYAITNETRRLQELLREGHRFARASEIIEAEKAQKQKGTS